MLCLKRTDTVDGLPEWFQDSLTGQAVTFDTWEEAEVFCAQHNIPVEYIRVFDDEEYESSVNY